MKELELDLRDAKKKADVADLVRGLMGYPDWDGKKMSDWLSTIAAHQGVVPHLRSSADERFMLRLVHSSEVRSSTILAMARWVVKINQRAVELDFQPPLVLSIE